jgi:predicted amidohydrolase
VPIRVALGQINTTIGDFEGNLALIRRVIARAQEAGADLVILPELVLSGYPPMDLLDRPTFVRDQAQTLEALARESDGIAIVAGAIVPAPAGTTKRISSAAVALEGGAIAHVQAKTLLPTYDVFDEARYFAPATSRRPWVFRGHRIGLTVCEDVWSGEFFGSEGPYPIDPVEEQVRAGADLIVNVSASPWEQRKHALREEVVSDAARRLGVPFVFCNLVGGNDELVFDGASFVVDGAGRVIERLARFEEDFATIDPLGIGHAAVPQPEDDVELLEGALVLGIRDYLHKLGLDRVVIGLSGGVDSSVTAHLAERALGPENVVGILMPGPFSSEHSITDARALAENLGIETRTVRIDSVYKTFIESYHELFGPAQSYGITQENLQARVRGTLLMSVSNHENRIVLARASFRSATPPSTVISSAGSRSSVTSSRGMFTDSRTTRTAMGNGFPFTPSRSLRRLSSPRIRRTRTAFRPTTFWMTSSLGSWRRDVRGTRSSLPREAPRRTSAGCFGSLTETSTSVGRPPSFCG